MNQENIPFSDDIRSFAGTSYPPIAKSNEGLKGKRLLM